MHRALAGLGIAALATAAFAGPYSAGTGRCPGLVANNVYRCAVRGEDGSQSTDCFRFATPGHVSGKFEFVSDRLATTIGCTCKPGGSAAAPAFGASASFTCTSTAGVSFEGFIRKDGTIGKGSVSNANGGSYAFTCQPDAACVASP